MRRFGLVLAVPLLSACALTDPHILTGPEQGYCFASRQTSGDHAAGCPSGHRRHVAWVGHRETAAHLDEALAFLRDRRRQMSERERELAQIYAVSRLGVAAASLTAIGAAAYGGARDLVIGAGLGTGAAYLTGTGFASQGVRDVYNAGVAALACVETRALSARIAPQSWQTQQRGRLRVALAVLATRMGQARSLLAQDSGVNAAEKARLEQVLREAEVAESSTRAALGNLSGAPLSGPLIANAVYDRALSIVIQVNNEVDRAAPNLEAIMNLARSSVSTSLNGVADAAAALRNGSAAARVVEAAGGDGAKPAAAASAAPPRTASEAESGLASAAAAVADAIDLLSNDLASLPQDPVTQIRSCAFQQAEGRGLTISPGTTPTIGPRNATSTLSVTGGRGPYRISRTGSGEANLTAEPEFSPSQFTLRNRGATAGQSASFMLTDQGGESAVITLTVR